VEGEGEDAGGGGRGGCRWGGEGGDRNSAPSCHSLRYINYEIPPRVNMECVGVIGGGMGDGRLGGGGGRDYNPSFYNPSLMSTEKEI
jgi:hypothetical protein